MSWGTSDHNLIGFRRRNGAALVKPRIIRKRIYKNFDKTSFIKDLEEAKSAGKFDDIFTSKSPDEALEVFEKTFSDILDVHAPLKVIQN